MRSIPFRPLLVAGEATAVRHGTRGAESGRRGFGGTNNAAQSGLETIAMLGLVGDHLPREFPPAPPAPAKQP
jgi:hypothetical protein